MALAASHAVQPGIWDMAVMCCLLANLAGAPQNITMDGPSPGCLPGILTAKYFRCLSPALYHVCAFYRIHVFDGTCHTKHTQNLALDDSRTTYQSAAHAHHGIFRWIGSLASISDIYHSAAPTPRP